MSTNRYSGLSGPLHQGKTGLVMHEAPTSAGSKEVRYTTDADTNLVTLYVETTAGDVDVSVYTEADDGYRLKVITFPTISSPTSEIIIRKAASMLDNVIVEATWTGACEFDIRAKGIGVGELNTRVLGASDGRASQKDIDDSATVIVPAALTDRAGMVLKNFNASGGAFLFIGFSAAEANEATGYPIGAGESIGIDMAAGVEVYGIAEAGESVDVRILEAAS